MSGFQLQRLGLVMEPEPGNPLEVEGVLNPAAVRGPDGELYLFPRLVARGNYSRIGIVRVRFNEAGDPSGVERIGIALEPEADYERRSDGGGGCEDPRITFVEPLRRYLMTYTALSPNGPRIALAVSEDLFHWQRLGLATFRPYNGIEFDGVDDKDASIFPIAINDPSGQPALAHDTNGTIDEARRLWSALNRFNVLIKVPATTEELQAIKQLISEGINVNVTLLFGLPRYRQVAKAYITGIEARLAQGESVKYVASVASFFVSRIDVLVGSLLEKIIVHGDDEVQLAKQMYGQVAIASAKVAYQIYRKIFSSDRFKKLTDQGAISQRLLWASTGTKNREFIDVKYVEALIGADTVDTVPVKTLDAYRDHGEPKARLEQDAEKSEWVLQRLPALGINIDKLTQQLEEEGVEKFNHPFDELMETLAKKCNGI